MGSHMFDDKSEKHVENHTKYVTDSFAFARKLFVKWTHTSPNRKPLDDIRRDFCVFGPIESIEIVNAAETNVEAYVLFEKSESAFEAFQAHRVSVKSTTAASYEVIANTRHESLPIPLCSSIDSKKCFILKLNDDCLIELFKYFDLDCLVKLSNVCKRFRTLLSEYKFPKIKTHTIYVDQTKINVSRQTMECIGPHLVHLYLIYSERGKNSGTCLNGVESIELTTCEILQNITKNLTKITIRKPQKPSNRLMNIFSAAFQQITFLDWDAEFDCDTMKSLQHLCPCLKTLILRRRVFSCHCDHDESKLHWPSLGGLEMFQYMAELDVPCQRFLERFIQENMQFKHLKLTNVNQDLFQTIINYSKNLEHFEMLQNFDQNNEHLNLPLELLNNLNSLRICIIRMKSIEFLSDVVDQIQSLNLVYRLELIVLLQNYAPLGWQNEYFPLAHQWPKITIDGYNMNLQIGENFANIEFGTGKTTLVNIINTNNPRESSYKRLKRDVRRLFQKSNWFFSNVHDSFVFKNTDCYQFIHVNSVK